MAAGAGDGAGDAVGSELEPGPGVRKPAMWRRPLTRTERTGHLCGIGWIG